MSTDLVNLVIRADSREARTASKDIDGLSESSKQAGGSSKKASGDFRGLALAIKAAAVTIVTSQIVRQFENMRREIDESAKAARSMGIAFEEFQALNIVGARGGVADMTTAIDALNRNISNGSDLFGQLGVSVENSDGTLRGTYQVFEDLADSLSRYADGAEKSRVAQELMGRGGARLISAMKDGSSAFRDAERDAQRFGLTLDQSAVKAAEDLGDRMTDIGLIFRGAGQRIFSPMLEPLTNIVEAMIEFGTESEATRIVMDNLLGTGNGLTKVMQGLAIGFIYATSEAAALSVQLNVLLHRTTGELTTAANSIDKIFGGISDAWATIARTGNIEQAWDDIVAGFRAAEQGELRNQERNMGEFADMQKQAAERTEKIWDDFSKSMARIMGYNVSADSLLLGSENKEQMRIDRAKKTNDGIVDILTESNMRVFRDFEALLYNEEDALRHSWQRRIDQIMESEQLLESDKMILAASYWERYELEHEQLLDRIAQREHENNLQMARDRIDAFSGAFSSMSRLSEQFFGEQAALTRAFTLADIAMSFQRAIVDFQAMKMKTAAAAPFPANLPLIAGAVALGSGILSQMASARSGSAAGAGGGISAPSVAAPAAGVVSGSSSLQLAPQAASVRIVNVVDPSVVSDWAQSPTGEQSIVNSISRAPERDWAGY